MGHFSLLCKHISFAITHISCALTGPSDNYFSFCFVSGPARGGGDDSIVLGLVFVAHELPSVSNFMLILWALKLVYCPLCRADSLARCPASQTNNRSHAIWHVLGQSKGVDIFMCRWLATPAHRQSHCARSSPSLSLSLTFASFFLSLNTV